MAQPTISSMLPGIIASFAFIVSLFAGVYCHFISFASTDGGDNPITLNFGIWYYQGWSVVNSNIQGEMVLESCFYYPDGINLDSKWRSAMAFSILTLVIGGVVTFWALLACCLFPSRGSYKAGGMAYLLCCLFQGLTLIFLDSNACHNNLMISELQQQVTGNVNVTFPSSCSMAEGAKCAIAGTVLWFVAAIVVLKVDPPERSPITQETQDVTYTQTTGADGTAVVSETFVKGEPVVVGVGKEEVAEQAV